MSGAMFDTESKHVLRHFFYSIFQQSVESVEIERKEVKSIIILFADFQSVNLLFPFGRIEKLADNAQTSMIMSSSYQPGSKAMPNAFL